MSPSLEQRLRSDTSFERLYRRHRRDVYGAVLRDVRDPEEAEDVTQIAFLNALRAMRRGKEPDKPRAWLVTIARNVIRRRYRELARRPQQVPLDPEVAATLVEVDGPTAGEIAGAIGRLPPNQRAVILLREIQGRSYADIAAELGLSLGAVEALIFRARRSLSEELTLADRISATQPRRARGLFLPLPGFGKLSLGFSVSRIGLAALVGGVIVTVPISDRDAGPRRPPAVQRGPSLAERIGPLATSPAFAPVLQAVPKRTHQREDGRRTVKPKRTGGDAQTTDGGGAGTAALPSVPSSPVELPPTDDLSLPPLPVAEPALPSPPAEPLPLDPLDLVEDLEPVSLPGE